MRRVALIALLILASCGGDGEPAMTVPPAPPLTTLASADPPPTTEATPVPSSTTFAADDTTTTTLAPNAKAVFALSQVVFGDGAFVIVTNWGNDTGDLLGLWLQQGEMVVALPAASLAPGEQAMIGLGRDQPLELAGVSTTIDLGPVLGPVSLQSGEVGLSTGDDEFSRALISYVAWGDGPHLLAEAATATGVWDESNVAVIDDAPSISTGVYPATDAPDWSADIGG